MTENTENNRLKNPMARGEFEKAFIAFRSCWLWLAALLYTNGFVTPDANWLKTLFHLAIFLLLPDRRLRDCNAVVSLRFLAVGK